MDHLCGRATPYNTARRCTHTLAAGALSAGVDVHAVTMATRTQATLATITAAQRHASKGCATGRAPAHPRTCLRQQIVSSVDSCCDFANTAVARMLCWAFEKESCWAFRRLWTLSASHEVWAIVSLLLLWVSQFPA
jgi:hypothetical protein